MRLLVTRFGSPSNETLKNGLVKGTDRREFNIDPRLSVGAVPLPREGSLTGSFDFPSAVRGWRSNRRIGVRCGGWRPRHTLAHGLPGRVPDAKGARATMKEAPGINPFRNDPSGRRLNAWLLRDGLGSALGSPSSPTRFRLQIPTGSSRSTAVKPKTGSEWSGASSSEPTASGELWPVECRPRKLADLERLRRKLPEDPAYGAAFWRRQLVELLSHRP
jgi:hypothetical protein